MFSEDPYARTSKDEAELGLAAWAFVWLNIIIVFGGLGVVVFWLDVGIYRWLLDADEIGLLIVFGGMALAVAYIAALGRANRSRTGFLARRVPHSQLGRAVAKVWSYATVVFFVLILMASFGDASRFNHHNCWTISEQERDSITVEVLECVPGSEPRQGTYFSRVSESGSFTVCDQLDITSSGGTIWRCESGEI